MNTMVEVVIRVRGTRREREEMKRVKRLGTETEGREER
jgi:hypothetical protein